MKKILVLTSGGDGAGMNAYLKAVAKLCEKNDLELFGAIRGFKGLIDDDIEPIKYSNFNYEDNLGGSIIKSSRCPEFTTEQGFNKALNTIKKHQFDCVVVVGGNGSLKGAKRLSEYDVNVIGIPATIDNDLSCTDLTLGFDTACHNVSNLIAQIKQSTDCFDRGLIVEVMGRDCADIALQTAFVANADLCYYKNTSQKTIIDDVKKLGESKNPLIIVKEYLFDLNALADKLRTETNRQFKYVVAGYVQRGGMPTNVDKTLAIEFAIKTVENINFDKFGVILGKKHNKIVDFSFNGQKYGSKKYSKTILDNWKKYN